jgi:hypothetical protein
MENQGMEDMDVMRIQGKVKERGWGGIGVMPEEQTYLHFGERLKIIL